MFNVNYNRRLIKRPKLQKRHNRRRKERPDGFKKSRINKKRLLKLLNAKKPGNYKKSSLPRPKLPPP